MPAQRTGPLRVIHLPTTAGGNPQGLSRALDRLGVHSESWIFEQNVYNYPATHSIWSANATPAC